MITADRWLLPDGIDELLPPQALQLEQLRRQILDLYYRWGYDLVFPPHLEYMESLQAGAGRDLELMTFKVIDQMTGRMMGLRADTTPAVARMDAHTLKRSGPVRLCYAGSVFHTLPASLNASRSPIQIGAELYGHKGYDSDIEVISLLLETLRVLQPQQLQLELGHVGIYRGLVAQAGLDQASEQTLFSAFQRKARDEIEAVIKAQVADLNLQSMLLALPRLSGGAEVLAEAQNLLASAAPEVKSALDALEQVAAVISQRYPSQSLYFDLSELPGYSYHTGIVFAAYIMGQGQAIARGGRYDGIGQVFGRARPATGFSCDLKKLQTLMAAEQLSECAIYAPIEAEAAVIEQLRQNGERVINALPDTELDPIELGCDRILCQREGFWQVVPLGTA